MTKTTSRRRLLGAGACALGAATLGKSFAPLTLAQTAGAELARIDLGYASLVQGAGCNVFIIPGINEDGVLMVDGGLAAHAESLLAMVREVTGQERVHTLINTHFHPEQSGSNELAGAGGARIIAHENTRMCLQNALLSASYEGRYGPLAPAGIPTETMRSDGTMKFAGQEIIYGYLPAAHTNGDIFLYFPMLDTLVTGGPLTTGQWPVLDYRQGGWIGGLVNAYDRLAAVVSADTVVIPGHGPVTNGTAVIRMRNMYSELHLTLSEQLNIGMGWDDIVAQNPLKQYEDRYGEAAYFLETAHRSLQLAYVPD